jgi:hypothetical protein
MDTPLVRTEDTRRPHARPEPSPDRTTRSQVIRGAVLGGSLIAGGALVGRSSGRTASARPSPRQDTEILNFLLLVEYVQQAFYDEAVEHGALRGELLDFATTVRPQEGAHVALLQSRLGAAARRRPRVSFGGRTQSDDAFRGAALRLEELATAAYIGQGANLTARVMGDAARIVSVEARHAAWIRSIAGTNPAPRAADPPQTAQAVMAALREEGFIR